MKLLKDRRTRNCPLEHVASKPVLARAGSGIGQAESDMFLGGWVVIAGWNTRNRGELLLWCPSSQREGWCPTQ